ncbi:MAG: hypothetical protein WDN00_17460 [Limisphaerales bacterium]
MSSPLISAAQTEYDEPFITGEDAITKPPFPLFVNTVKVASLKFALIKSTLPSPLTSVAMTHCGSLPTPGEEARTKDVFWAKALLKLAINETARNRKWNPNFIIKL